MENTAAVSENQAASSASDGLLEALRALLGAGHVLTDARDTVFFSTDIFTQGVTAEAVVAPGSVEELAKAVALCTGHGRSVIPRGGGFSYTQGYIPALERTVSFDLRRLNNIVEINGEDLYVVVEAGCTWVQLYNALKDKGYRTPYFGPMSGYRSTVGGALSQGSFFLGSTQYGTTADTVLGLEVVLADGSVLTTGSAASTVSSSPHFRNYGPDLTGPFLHDAGALGLKARAILKLIPFPKHSQFASFAFDDEASAVAAVSDIARDALAAECYLWDPEFAAGMRDRNSMLDDFKYLGGVIGSGSNPLAGLWNALRIALAGKRIFDNNAFLMHVTIDDATAAGADGKLLLTHEIARRHGGKAMEPSVPRALRGMPFNDFAIMAEANPQNRNLPTHGLFPHSKIGPVAAEARRYLSDNKALMAEHGITQGTIFFAVGANAVCIEPLLYWTDAQLGLHNRLTDKTDIEALAKIPERTAAAKAVAQLRGGLVEIFTRNGAAYCQIGKSYPYRQTRQPGTYRLLEAIKAAVDPQGRVNPGALGLDKPS